MEHGAVDSGTLLWFFGWLIAVGVLFMFGMRLPLQGRLAGLRSLLFVGGVIVAAIAVTVLANSALMLHDMHIDLTREKIFTPSRQAMELVETLNRPVRLTYFYRGNDPSGQRIREVLEVMGRRNALFEVRTVDPDREPSVAQSFGVRLYNAAVIEADGRKILVQGTDEDRIAIGIQRVLRERVITICFVEGHNELPMDSFEFHTHLEGLAGHSHDDSSSSVVKTAGHGIGRLRRVLEAQGYETRKLVLATSPRVPAECSALIIANPRTLFLPDESTALRDYLQGGGALFAMFDLGFVLESRLATLFADLGVTLPQQAVVDPLSHYSSDAEMVAVATYAESPITKNLSMTFFPGIRPLQSVQAKNGIVTMPLFSSSRDSYVREITPVAVRETRAPAVPAATPSASIGPRVLAVTVQGRLSGADVETPELRTVIVGDGDFASNSFLPYLANGDLALAIVRWLVREDRDATVSTRIPVPPMVLLSSEQMKIVFIVIELALPLAVLALGFAVWWRRR